MSRLIPPPTTLLPEETSQALQAALNPLQKARLHLEEQAKVLEKRREALAEEVDRRVNLLMKVPEQPLEDLQALALLRPSTYHRLLYDFAVDLNPLIIGVEDYLPTDQEGRLLPDAEELPAMKNPGLRLRRIKGEEGEEALLRLPAAVETFARRFNPTPPGGLITLEDAALQRVLLTSLDGERAFVPDLLGREEVFRGTLLEAVRFLQASS